jgi:hypothetical protein
MTNHFEPYSSNVTSQSGEDGILAEIFRRIGTAHKTCVEFGAWDGKYLSNTWSLWHDQGWSAVLIEGNPERHGQLAGSLSNFPNVTTLCAYVQPEGECGLDNLLVSTGIEMDFDLLSIDVDGDDYHIWQGMERFRPRVVIIEYNPTIPPELELVQKRGGYFGASASALVSLATSKGYRLVSCTKTNCIFVEANQWNALGLDEVNLEDVFPRGHLTYVINSYDGKTYLNRVPTYSYELPSLTSGVLYDQLKASLSPDFYGIERPANPVAAVAPVRIFACAEQPPQKPLVLRGARRMWRAFVATPVGAPLGSFIGKRKTEWRQTRESRAAIAAWKQKGCPVPPPHVYKQYIVRDYARRHRLRNLVETGTYLGDMVEAMRVRFQHVYSIELDHQLYRRATERFASSPNVTIRQGDSGQVLSDLLGNLLQPTLFWLDGHFSADITARGDKDTPILKELESIASHAIKRHVILIDDARCFNGTNDYPTQKELETTVQQYWPGSSFEVKDDIIRIVTSS